MILDNLDDFMKFTIFVNFFFYKLKYFKISKLRVCLDCM